MYKRQPWDECDARQQLLATPLAANDAWEREPVGVGAGIELLGAPTLSSKYRFAREAWADADTPLPALMSGPRRADVDPALSDDESDTEIDGEWHPPTEERLRQLYTLPAPPAAEAEGEAAEGEAAEGEAAAGGAAAEDDDALARVAPERIVAVDGGSERARAAAALQAEHWEKRLALAAKFRSELLATNALIGNPRLRISPD